MSRHNVHKMPGIMPGNRLYRQEKPKRNYRGLGFVILISGLACGSYWFFFLSPTFAIDQVTITGTDNESLKTIGDRLIGTNSFRLNSATLEQDMQQAYPPVATVTVVRGLPRVVRINVTLRQPKLRWVMSDTTLFILDANGQVFSQGDKPEYAPLPKVMDRSNEKLQIGQQVVLPAFIQFLNEIQAQSPALFHQNQTANEVTDSIFTLDMVFENTLRIRLTTQRPSKEQLESAALILAAHPEAKLVDVRVPARAYWR